MDKQYNLPNIRALLTQGFTDQELRHLSYDTPIFRPVYNQLAESTGKATIVNLLIEYAEQTMQFEALLNWANEKNPIRFEAHQPYYDDILEKQTAQIQLILDGEIANFTSDKRDILVGVLATVLKVEPSRVRIVRVQSGSIQVTIEVPEQSLMRLNSLSQTDISLLVSVGIQIIEGDTLKTLDLHPSLANDVVITNYTQEKSQPMEKFSINKPTPAQFEPTIGIIAALPKEFTAVEVLLENTSDYFAPGVGAGRRYKLGTIPAIGEGQHRIVLSLAGIGTNIAALRAASLLEHFPSITSIIMVGIAGGIPHPKKRDEHVRLGDIVVSDQGGVIQYDFDKEEIDETVHRHPPRPPSATLLDGVRLLQVAELKGERPWLKFIEKACNVLYITRPSAESDILVRSTPLKRKVLHPADPKRTEGQPRIFTGPIASANKLLKNPLKRDYLRDKFGVKAVEMEGSGIADATWNHERGYLIVRGICDYCDANKGDNWQNYAAIVAAAYTRALLESMPAQTSTPKIEKVETPAAPLPSKPGLKSSWIFDLPEPRPILPESAISARLNGYPPFHSFLAERELEYLFGEVGCFWSRHHTYATLADDFYPQVVVAGPGSGKTAFAFALTQIGSPEGVLLPGTLPILISGENHIFKEAQSQITRALLHFINANAWVLSNLNQAQQQFLLRLLINGLGLEFVKLRLSQVIEADKSLANMIEQIKPPVRSTPTLWLPQVKQNLELLGFKQAILAIDLNQASVLGLKFWLSNMLPWASHSLIIKLFLPEPPGPELRHFLDPVETLTLTWTDKQITDLAHWRCDSLGRLAGLPISLGSLFDEGLDAQFIAQAGGNPGRLARLWRSLFDHHLADSPTQTTFTAENLARAVEQLSLSR